MSTFIDREILKEISLRRAKVWANILEKYRDVDDTDELLLDDIEATYQGDDERHLGKKLKRLQAKETIECNDELAAGLKREIDCTKNVIKDHNNAMMQTGLDKMLNSFDIEQIEKAEKAAKQIQNIKHAFNEITKCKIQLNTTKITIIRREQTIIEWNGLKSQRRKQEIKEVAVTSEAKNEVICFNSDLKQLNKYAAKPTKTATETKLCKDFNSKLKINSSNTQETKRTQRALKTKDGISRKKQTAKKETTCYINNASELALATPEMVLIYRQDDAENVPSECLKNGQFWVTESYLSKFIGAHLAQKFIRVNCRPLRFNARSTVYYCPPESQTSKETSDSDTDNDIFESCERYGTIRAF